MNDYNKFEKNLKKICDIFIELLNKSDNRIILYINAMKLINFAMEISNSSSSENAENYTDKSIFERLFGKK